MTEADPGADMELEMEEEYLIGLLDYLTIPKLTPYQTAGSGYGLSTEVWINVRQSDILAGLLTDVLDSLGISFRLDYRGDTPGSIVVGKSSSIKQLRDLGKGSYIQIAQKLEYLVDIDKEYRGEPISADPELFLKIYKPWAELHPEWGRQNSKKYTLDFFKSKFDISSISNVQDLPEVTYPDEIAEEYVSGLFDAKGSLRLLINKSNEYSVGYAMAPSLRVQITQPHLLVGPHLKKFFETKDFNIKVQEENSRLRVQLSNVDGIEKFIEFVGPDTYYNYEICDLFYKQLLPAYEDGYHHTKDGFFDMVRAYEQVRNSDKKHKYDTEHFKFEWDL